MKTTYSHTYSVFECPECAHNLRQRGGVTIELLREGAQAELLESFLEQDGKVADVDGSIKHGFHSDTLCGLCAESLSNFEVIP